MPETGNNSVPEACLFMTESIDFNTLTSLSDTLSIRLSTDGFSFSISDAAKKTTTFNYPAHEDLPLTANLKRALHEMKWPHGTFQHVNILMTDERFTLVPLDLFNCNMVEELFHYNFPKKDNEQLSYNMVKQAGIVVLFGIDKTAYHFLQKQYPNANFYSHATSLIEYISRKNKQALSNRKRMYVYMHKGMLDVFCYNNDTLSFANSYKCNNRLDSIYYILYIWHTISFKQKEDELFLLGDMPEKEGILAELQKFISQVSIIDHTEYIDLQ